MIVVVDRTKAESEAVQRAEPRDVPRFPTFTLRPLMEAEMALEAMIRTKFRAVDAWQRGDYIEWDCCHSTLLASLRYLAQPRTCLSFDMNGIRYVFRLDWPRPDLLRFTLL